MSGTAASKRGASTHIASCHAPELAALRDDAIFPFINRREWAHTIYPPAAQIVFHASYLVVGGTVIGGKIVMVCFDLGAVGLLARLLSVRGKDPRYVLLYAWHPLACWEVGHSGHVDAVAIAMMAGALLASHRSRAGLAGVLLGLATLVKGYPISIAPALLGHENGASRSDWQVRYCSMCPTSE